MVPPFTFCSWPHILSSPFSRDCWVIAGRAKIPQMAHCLPSHVYRMDQQFSKNCCYQPIMSRPSKLSQVVSHATTSLMVLPVLGVLQVIFDKFFRRTFWQFFLTKFLTNFLTNFFTIFLMTFSTSFLNELFLTNFFWQIFIQTLDDFFLANFLTNLLTNFLMKFLATFLTNFLTFFFKDSNHCTI